MDALLARSHRNFRPRGASNRVPESVAGRQPGPHHHEETRNQ